MSRGHSRQAILRLAALALWLVGASHAPAQILYAADGGGAAAFSTLYTVNPMSGAILSTIGAVSLAGNSVPISAMSFHPLNGSLYAITNQGTSSRLVTINPATAIVSSVGVAGLSMQSLAFDSNGVLYGYSKAGVTGNVNFPNESLYTINTGTGAATVIGSSGFLSSQGDAMTISAAGTIFFSGHQSAGQLSTLSPSTGTASSFANFTGGPSTPAPLKGFTFDNSGSLFGIYNGATTNLVKINTNPVGGIVTITDVGAFSPTTPSVMIALAFQPNPVPEPSSLALIGLVTSIGIFRKLAFHR